MITTLNHASFTVSDLATSVAFYKDVLGLRLLDLSSRPAAFSERVTGIENAVLEIAYFEIHNARLELIEYVKPEPKTFIDTATCHVGSAHICFNVDSFDELVERLATHKVQFAGEVCQIPDGPNKGKKVLYFEDPDSNSIEIISNQKMA